MVGVMAVLLVSCSSQPGPRPHVESGMAAPSRVDLGQIPGWSSDDLDFFQRGSMSGEFIPEKTFRALVRANPDLFPNGMASFGFVTDPGEDLPVGMSRREVPHLGDQVSIGLNCAACHVGEVKFDNHPPMRVMGMTSSFDPEAFYNATVIAMLRASQPAGMKKYLGEYVREYDHRTDLSGIAKEHLNLFHNIGVALHLPAEPPKNLPPPSGPGRNTAFGLLSAVLFNEPTPYAPTKFSPVWNADQRTWVHWDGNTSSPINRNILASLGLGAPLEGRHAIMDFSLVDRQTQLSEAIRPPRYPLPVNEASASRGASIYAQYCAKCHDVPAGYEDKRLHSVTEVGTDPARVKLFTAKQAALYNDFFAKLQLDGYTPSAEPTVRSTGKYVASDLAGVWARSPYLHNGSMRTMRDLLTPPAERPKTFRRGDTEYDTANMGYKNKGSYVFDTSTPGNFNSGHDYGTSLSQGQKKDLIEFLKTK